MKQRTSFILKGLISLVLSLVMLCGTAVTSLSAVTVDLAETGDQVGTVTLYFTNNKSWKSINAYIWDSSSGGHGELSAYPGEALSYIGLDSSNYAVYSVTVDTTKYDMIVFNGNGGDAKTTDIQISDAVSNGRGVKCSDSEYATAIYYPKYYSFGSDDSSTAGLDHNVSYYIGTEASYRYMLVPYGTDKWVIYDSNTKKYMKALADNGRITSNKFTEDTASSATQWTFVDFGGAWQSLGGARFTTDVEYTDPRGGGTRTVTAYILYTNDGTFKADTDTNYRINATLAPKVAEYKVTVTKKSSIDNYNYYDDPLAGVIKVLYSGNTSTINTSNAYGTVSGIPDGTEVTIIAEASEGYTFLGWFTDESWVKVTDSITLTINGLDVNLIARFSKKAEIVTGTYKFTYDRRNIEVDGENTTWTKTVTRQLVGAEIDGYDGNGYNSGMPTYLYTSRAKMLFGNSPLLTASFAVQGNADEQDNVSTYKNDIVWPDMAVTALTDGCGIGIDTNTKTVTVTATTTPVTFTFKYVIKGGNVTEGATKVPYGKVVTFNPLYQNSNYCYIAEDIPSDGFSYWSSDPAGNNILTTNRTFGMLLRGGSAVEQEDGTLVVTAYAQYDKDVPENKWLPEIEEATLTRTIADGEDLTYADYMTNYFNYDGIAVQDMLKDSQYNGKIKYGILVVKSKSDLATTKLTKDQMKNALNSMHALDGTKDAYTPYCASAALNNARTRIAYRYEYDDAAHISNFNRTLYTLYGNEAKMNGYTFTAMAYITFDGGENYECSEVNTELVVDNTPSSN